ncbi:SOS response-associated peptidase [Elusimicrobiota bacterium]
MCGRYTQTASLETLQRRFGFRVEGASLSSRYNIAPGQTAPVLLQDRTMAQLRWGLVPSWAKDRAIGARMINARSETAADKPAFRTSFDSRRCLVLADGFYEWRKARGAPKVPWRFARKDREPFAFAGLWDSWQDPDGQDLWTFTILTTEANPLVRRVHPRMPVILRRDDEGGWLDDASEIDRLQDLLAPHPVEELEGYEVSTRVNSPQHDDAQCIAPATQLQPELGL